MTQKRSNLKYISVWLLCVCGLWFTW